MSVICVRDGRQPVAEKRRGGGPRSSAVPATGAERQRTVATAAGAGAVDMDVDDGREGAGVRVAMLH
jgi:hypothetical protein